MPVLPLRTSRLLLRIMRPSDAAVMARYHADSEVARYQNWNMPYTEADATDALTRQDDLDDVTPGRWVQIALETADGMLVGDAAVGLDPTGSVAGLGYTLAPASQGRGFASEAAAALVDAVFARTPVHRMLVTLDPDNHASLRVVEPLGFRYEGLARQAERIRGEWVDDLRFALLRDEHAAWRSRPRTPPGLLELVPITTGNLDAVGDLTTFRFQQAFVSPMARSLAQALVPGEHHGRPITPWFRAIVADGEVAGFVMVAEPDAGSPDPYLWRLLIDRAHQRRGIGRRTVAALVRTFAATGRTAMLVSWREGPGGPENFYRGLGFVPTGEKDEDEIVARLTFGDVRT